MDLNGSAQVGWTSMGVAKLAVDALMPLVLLVLGILINKRTKRLEQAIWGVTKTKRYGCKICSTKPRLYSISYIVAIIMSEIIQKFLLWKL